jgi:ribonuclease HII
MAWILGIDEAGYGPNLGPLVMTAVACRVPDEKADANLWHTLASAVRQGVDPHDGRLLVDDSKVVYSTTKGLGGLEHNVLAALWRAPLTAQTSLSDYLSATSAPFLADLQDESWFKGSTVLPCESCIEEVATAAVTFDEACTNAAVDGWLVRSAIIATPRFNDLVDANGSKGAVLAHAFCHLLRSCRAQIDGDGALTVFVDKHGGRNTYAALIQHALSDGMVVAEEESMHRSAYRVLGLERPIRLTFQPRADSSHFCVALASMASKYGRELLMREFNAFWQQQVPGLKATAGYPLDATRFLNDITPAAQKLGLTEDRLWRRK